jgi:Bacterial mobilisation protein (MobC)
MPRRYKADPRTYFKTFRFSAAEITRLENRARARRQGLSEYVRATLFAKDETSDTEAQPASGAFARNQAKRGHDLEDYPVGRAQRGGYATRVLIDQLRRIGTNLNQIAHRMNERRTPPPRELTMLLDDIRAYVRQAREP